MSIPFHRQSFACSAARWIVVLFVNLAIPFQSLEGQSDETFFRTKVEPILAQNCLSCHSHVAGEMEGGLTLDFKSGWASGGDSGPALVPKHPEKSLLIKAVRYADADLQMPPEGKLSDEEIEILVQWVRRGAHDPRRLDPKSRATMKSKATDWWSLKKLVAPKVPGPGHPVDAFLRNRRQRSGLSPSRPADRATLIRRLYVDLHGYLPTPNEVQAFNKDQDPVAWTNLVDRLLASPRYGERWARHWLDVIHFADSHGCEHDVKRPNAWRFRDYVIDRLNSDVRWDRFVREQLAADVFYPREPQLKAALGFVAAGPLELSRAGTAPMAFDYLDRDDIVTQTMAAFVSTTANCARCHTHKFDPITQEDYYALQAVFAGVGKGDIQYDVSPRVMKRRKKLEKLALAVRNKEEKVLLDPAYRDIVQSRASYWRENPVVWQTLKPETFIATGGGTLTKQVDDSILASGKVAEQENYLVTSEVPVKRLAAIRLEVLTDKTLPKNGPGRAENGNLHLSEVEFRWFPAGSSSGTKLDVAGTSADFDQQGWNSAQAIDGDEKTGWAIHPRVNESHQIVFEFAKPIESKSGGKLFVSLKQLYPPQHVIGKFRLSVTDSDSDSARLLPASIVRSLAKPANERTREESVSIAALILGDYVEKELAKLPDMATVYGISSSWSHAKKLAAPQSPKTVHLLRRGAFDRPVKEIGPGALSAIEALPSRFAIENPDQESLRRAALANWLAHPENPLTWRSIVNRVWQYHFGRGLCDTPNDFGRMGSQPSHPELLDYLAVWFRDEAKGSLKQLHRLILTSEAWRQTSRTEPRPLDSDNRLLWRMNRQRLDAEVFRDSVLRIAGRLDVTMGGQGVEQFVKTKGPQATPALDYSAFDWESEGANRRSIYRVVWRGIPDPFMEALDFPDLGLLTPKRGLSISALQSLAIYNNDFVLKGSQWFAARVSKERDELESQVDRAVELAWLRSPRKNEHRLFVAYAREHGLAAFCRLLLNSNEFLFVD